MSKSEIEVFVGVDMAKEEHYAQAITTQGAEGRSKTRPLSRRCSTRHPLMVGLVVDMSSGAQLLLGVMARHPVW